MALLRSFVAVYAASGMLRAWVALLAFATGLSVLVAADGGPDEAGVVREVQGWTIPGQDLSDLVRGVTSTQFVITTGLLLAALHWLTRDRLSALVLAVLLFLLPAVQTGIKEVVDRPRPADAADGIEVRASQTSPSFPAGHVMGPVVVYGWALMVLVRKRGQSAVAHGGGRHRGLKPSASARWLRLPGVFVLVAVVVVAGPVNVWLGVHWPTDVLGGYLWGGVLLLPALAARQRMGGGSP